MSVKEIKNIIFTSSDEVLAKYVSKNFSVKKAVHMSKNSLAKLKKLDNDTLICGIARTGQIETHHDHSKYMPTLLTVLVIMFGIYRITLESWVVLLLGSMISMYILYTIKKERDIRAAAVYFHSLLVQVKELKKDRGEGAH